ncbi:hypothetical protein ABIB25_004666 [Nakamurella sp. UYEF19]|uniref:hypothetical protein n=1 Tax=Nakamurella sp. UYEF19 TaxID=1756392 RepID=UPI003391BB1C
MTALLTRIRPRSPRAARIRLTHRTQIRLAGALPASEERLASRSEIEKLQAKHLTPLA